jgi:hypothetical protein
MESLRLVGCVVRLRGRGLRLQDGYWVFGEYLGFLSRAPCPGAVWCSKRRGRFRGVFQVLGGFP